jgi:transposase
MDAIIERVGGVDVGQALVVATVLVGAAHERAKKETRTFRTVTRELLELREWFSAKGVTHVAMEGTGIYWRPVDGLREEAFEMILGNAQHIKNVPGRKTDVKDSEWLADLARHGLIAKSFVPPKPLRQLRDLLRYRRKLMESRTAERNRLLKLLETANIKLASVATDVFGVSGRLSMSGSRLEIEPHNWLRIDDLAGEGYPTIPHQGPSDAITINPVSTKSGAVHRCGLEASDPTRGQLFGPGCQVRLIRSR